jgi:hypothetical protein
MKLILIIICILITISTYRCLLSRKCDQLAILKDNCDYYKDCLEKKFKCGNEGYPLNYGYKKCSKFLAIKDQFVGLARPWLTKTLLCLKREIHKHYNENINCKRVDFLAFESHSDCYVEGGFCQTLLVGGQPFVKNLFKVLDITDITSISALKEIYDTAKQCGRKVEDELRKIIFKIFSPFG